MAFFVGVSVVIQLVRLTANRIKINNGIAERMNISSNSHKVSRVILLGRSLDSLMGYHKDGTWGKGSKSQKGRGELLPTLITDAHVLNIIGAKIDDNNIRAGANILIPENQSVTNRAPIDAIVDDDGPPNELFLQDMGKTIFCIVSKGYTITQQKNHRGPEG